MTLLVLAIALAAAQQPCDVSAVRPLVEATEQVDVLDLPAAAERFERAPDALVDARAYLSQSGCR
jgi:hypothetical protein